MKYFWIILPIWFISKLLSNKNRGSGSTYSRTYRRTDDDFFRNTGTSGSTNRRTYSGTFNSREEAEEFLELSLVEVLDKVQQVLVVALMVAGTVVKMVAVVIKEILIVHILPIKVNTILF